MTVVKPLNGSPPLQEPKALPLYVGRYVHRASNSRVANDGDRIRIGGIDDKGELGLRCNRKR